MSRLPTITPKEMVRIVEHVGFIFERQTGSHAHYRHPDGRITTIAMHTKDLPRGTMRKIMRDIGISEDEFRKML